MPRFHRATRSGQRHPRSVTVAAAVDSIERERRSLPAYRALLVGLTGIDGSGKGYIARQLTDALESRGHRVATINVDGWLSLPDVRFSKANPAEHFYLHALRLEEMFSTLVRPLRDRRGVRLAADVARETDSEYRQQLYEFVDIDVIVLEGIYLLKRAYQSEYDLSIWIDCSFETALQRAVARAQEGLAPDDTIAAYLKIYFPAQLIHAERDHPRDAASYILPNDLPRLLRSDARVVANT
jgi:uridine kinase